MRTPEKIVNAYRIERILTKGEAAFWIASLLPFEASRLRFMIVASWDDLEVEELLIEVITTFRDLASGSIVFRSGGIEWMFSTGQRQKAGTVATQLHDMLFPLP